MGEALIARGGSASGGGGGGYEYSIITQNQVFNFPKSCNYKITCIGGGGGGSFNGEYRTQYSNGYYGYEDWYGGGGGSGFINAGILKFNKGDLININIGIGGEGGEDPSGYSSYIGKYASGKTGSSTFFGDYLSANGGEGGGYNSGGEGGRDGQSYGNGGTGGSGWFLPFYNEGEQGKGGHMGEYNGYNGACIIEWGKNI